MEDRCVLATVEILRTVMLSTATGFSDKQQPLIQVSEDYSNIQAAKAGRVGSASPDSGHKDVDTSP